MTLEVLGVIQRQSVDLCAVFLGTKVSSLGSNLLCQCWTVNAGFVQQYGMNGFSVCAFRIPSLAIFLKLKRNLGVLLCEPLDIMVWIMSVSLSDIGQSYKIGDGYVLTDTINDGLFDKHTSRIRSFVLFNWVRLKSRKIKVDAHFVRVECW